jgi:DNA-binding beta-propeller fold protein YncE
LWLAVLLAVDLSAGSTVLSPVADVSLPGRTTRFDYQSLDPTTNTLYIAHMGDGELVAFDTRTRKVTARLPGFPIATGVLAVPGLHRVFTSVAGRHEVAVVDTEAMKVVARIPAGEFPDGLAYSPETRKVFVSDERGKKVTIIDAETNRVLKAIDMGGEVGNLQYDAGSGQILANVHTTNQIVVIDPRTETIVSRHVLTGGTSPHGLLIVASKRLAFAACDEDSKLLVVDLATFAVRQVLTTGDDPDVLAFDAVLGRLYVAAESGVVSVFQLEERKLRKLGEVLVAPKAHTIAVDSESHEVFLPIENVDGHPVLRIMKPAMP